MKQEKITKIKKEYYNNVIIEKILKEIYFPLDTPNIPYGRFYREVAILNQQNKLEKDKKKVAMRGLTFSNTGYLKKTIFNLTQQNYTFYFNDANLYCSVARVKQFPPFSYNSTKRKEETKPFFENEYKNYIYKYDIFLDFDLDENKKMESFLTEIHYFIKKLILFEVDFELVFSGNRGFKILLRNNYYTYESVIKIIPKIKEVFKLKYLDTSGSFIPSKLMKINFSLCFKNENCRFVYPLKIYNYTQIFQKLTEDREFYFFDYQFTKFAHLLNENEFSYNSDFYKITTPKKYKNLQKFIKEYKLLK